MISFFKRSCKGRPGHILSGNYSLHALGYCSNEQCMSFTIACVCHVVHERQQCHCLALFCMWALACVLRQYIASHRDAWHRTWLFIHESALLPTRLLHARHSWEGLCNLHQYIHALLCMCVHTRYCMCRCTHWHRAECMFPSHNVWRMEWWSVPSCCHELTQGLGIVTDFNDQFLCKYNNKT